MTLIFLECLVIPVAEGVLPNLCTFFQHKLLFWSLSVIPFSSYFSRSALKLYLWSSVFLLVQL